MDRTLIKKYIESQPQKVVTKMDLDKNKIEYQGILQGQIIKEIKGDEEMSRSFILTRLVNELGYSPDRIEIEHEYTAGRPHTNTSRIDIIVRDASGNAFLFIECKSPDAYASDDRDQIIEEQLYKVAGMERTEGNSVRYLVLYTTAETSENLFVERWYQLLRENGRLAAVLPESVFDTTENKYIRLFLYKYFTIKAVVSLPQISFEPYTSTKTSILFAQKKTAAEVKAWNDAWDSASKEYSHLVTQTKNLIAVANGTKQKAKLPSIKNLTVEQEREVLAKMLKNYLTELDDELDAGALIDKYSEELDELCTIDKETKDTFGFVNTWWVFGEVAAKLNYSVFMAEADNIGYKRTKRGERPMPNDLYRTDLSGDILFDDGVETTILDAMRHIDWN